MTDEKECFVISPIGSEGSDSRKRADKLLDYIIEDAVGEYGYETVRADEMSDPGSISTQIIDKVINTDLVVADLTDHNPNVFYELAVRHATSKPYIQMIDKSYTIPFDISDVRTINYGFDVEDAEQARVEIKRHIETIEEKDPTFDTPISKAVNMHSWQESGDPVEQSLADLLEGMNTLNRRIERLENEMSNEDSMRASKAKTVALSGISDGEIERFRESTEVADNFEKLAKSAEKLDEISIKPNKEDKDESQ